MNDVQEKTNIKINEMMRTIQDLKTKYNKEIEILVRTQVVLKMELKKLKNSFRRLRAKPSK